MVRYLLTEITIESDILNYDNHIIKTSVIINFIINNKHLKYSLHVLKVVIYIYRFIVHVFPCLRVNVPGKCNFFHYNNVGINGECTDKKKISLLYYVKVLIEFR